MSKDLTTSEIDSQNTPNNRHALCEIGGAAGIQGIPFEGETVVIKEQVASFFEATVWPVGNDYEKIGHEIARNGYEVLKGKRFKDMNLAIKALDVHETDFVNISNGPQLNVFDIRAFHKLAMLMTESRQAALVHVEFDEKLKNIVDESCVASLISPSRPAGPILSSRRVTHTSAGIFFPHSRHLLQEVAA